MTADTSWVDAMPEAYDTHLGPVLFAPYARHLAHRAAARGPQDVLELAAGTGLATAELVRALPGAAVTATDLNASMVAWGALRVPEATWQVADAQDLPFADGSFDLLVCQFGVMFFPDKPGAMAEMARVLRPGGTALLAVWDTISGSPLSAAFQESVAAVLTDDPPTFLPRVPHGYADPHQISADAQEGGLDVESLDRVVLRGAPTSARSLAEGFCLGSPLRFALQERGSLEELTEAIAADLMTRLGPGPVDGELAAFVITATPG